LANGCIWFDYSELVKQHDYTYLGVHNFPKRERTKRKQQVWILRLESMPEPERRVLSISKGPININRDMVGNIAVDVDGYAPDAGRYPFNIFIRFPLQTMA
jgi:hypothetical protein